MNGPPVSAGTACATITLAEGADMVCVGVTNDIGQSATYTVVITRSRRALTCVHPNSVPSRYLNPDGRRWDSGALSAQPSVM